MTRPLRVTIIGAGIGGLSSAIALRDVGAEPFVVERAPELNPVGAGICMWPNGGHALSRLGIADILDEISPQLSRLRYRDRAGRLVRDVSIDGLNATVNGQRSYPLARSDLHSSLLSRIDPHCITLGKTCVGVEQGEDGVRARFDDCSVIASDLLIGADGARSVVRDHVTDGAHHMRYHYTTWVGLVPANLGVTPEDTFTFHVGDAKRVGMLNVGQGRVYFFCDAVPVTAEDTQGARTELKSLFAGWCAEVQTLLDAVDDTETARLPVCDLDPLDTYTRGRVVLIGDAAHATTPTLGQGGALAMEDSLVLARCIADAPDHIDALKRFDALRMPRNTSVVLAARARTQATLEIDKAAAKGWQNQLASGISDDYFDELAKIYQGRPFADSAEDI